MEQTREAWKNNPDGQEENAILDAARPPGSAIPFHRLAPLLPVVSARILKASPEELDEIICLSLQEIFTVLGLERCVLLEVSQDLCKVVISYAWSGSDIEPVSSAINLAQTHPWTYNQLVVLGQTVIKYGVDSMPPDAVLDRQAFVHYGARSALAIPLFIGKRVRHIIAVHSIRTACVWPETFISSLRLLGEIFIGALARRDALRSLQVNQARLDIAVESSGVALWEIDLASGHIWATDNAKELFYFQQDDIITVSLLLEKVHPEDRTLITDAISKAVELAVESQVEYRVPAPDGSNRWMASRGLVQEKGSTGAKVMAGVTIEINQRKKMENKLAEQVQEISRLRELLEQENALLRSEVGLDEERHRSLGISTPMRKVKALVEQVAPTDSTVLIHGETGTGKELVAQAIHQLSDRSKRLMITVNCAALPAALIESELFGREKGAFTGAISRQAGRFELAHGSTLLLDEIAEMPLETQAKLLRVLQNGTFERLGSSVSIKAGVRIIAAPTAISPRRSSRGGFAVIFFIV